MPAISDSGSRVAPPGAAAAFSVYWYSFALTGNCDFALEGLAEDFSFFANKTGLAVIELIRGTPDYMGRNPEDNARMVIELAGQILGGWDAHP